MLWILRTFSLALLLITLAPLLKWEDWWVRVFDYPKAQKFILLLITWLVWIVVWWQSPSVGSLVWLLVLLVSLVYLGQQILTFTPLGKKMVPATAPVPERALHLIVSNVYQPNQEYSKALKMALDQSPDVLLFVETDQHWKTALNALEEHYPYRILLPQDNTYGMLFYSKLEICRQEIHYLVDEEIPSIEVDLKLRGGDKITLYGIHPTPPVPGENDSSTERDAEILIVGRKAKDSPLPVVVLGDLNDVAWSYTTELFLKVSNLADPRRGRGFFNTFHAKYPLLRWPLDHVFLSADFGLNDIQVLPSVNSDHFPISIRVTLCETEKADTLDADAEDHAESKENIEKAM